jgi:hypothetical protein
MIQHCVRIAKNVVLRINNAILRVIVVFWQGFFSAIPLQILSVVYLQQSLSHRINLG